MSKRKAEMVLELVDRATRPARKFMALQKRMGKATEDANRAVGRSAKAADQSAQKTTRSLARLGRAGNQAFETIKAGARRASREMNNLQQATHRQAASNISWANRQIEANKARRSALLGEAFAVAAVAGSLGAAMVPAIEFESAMAGVSKVIDFEDASGLKSLEKSILNLTTLDGLPMAASEIAEIIEAAGQAGVVDAALPDASKRQQLTDFARTAAQMGVAFGISAEEAGTAMAQWQSAMNLTQERSLVLGDAINHLSNNMNATAPALVGVIRRQGAVALTAGLSETQIAALSAAFLAGGATPEIAATALKNFTGALTDGEAMTERQRKALAKLGFGSEELARRMQVDARGSIMDVMEALSQLPEYEQGSILTQLFGEESKGAIAPLLTNLGLLEKAFNLMEDESSFAGSMLEEYAKQAATTANALKTTINYMNALAISVGSILLPEINELLAIIQPIIFQMTAWAEQNPVLVRTIFRMVAALLALKLVSISVRFAVFSIVGPFLHLHKGITWLSWAVVRAGGLFANFARFILWLNVAPIKMLIGGLGMLRGVLLGLGALVGLNPIGVTIIALAALAVFVYTQWDRITGWLFAKIDAIKEAFQNGIINGVFKVLTTLNPFALAMDAARGLLVLLMDIVGVPAKITDAFRNFSFSELLSNVFGKAMDIIQGFFSFGTDKATAPGANPQDAVQARARGGAFGPGWLLTGERGPELEYRNRGGYIAHHAALQSMLHTSRRAARNAALATGLIAASASMSTAAGMPENEGSASPTYLGRGASSPAGGTGPISIHMEFHGNVDREVLPDLHAMKEQMIEEIRELLNDESRSNRRREYS